VQTDLHALKEQIRMRLEAGPPVTAEVIELLRQYWSLHSMDLSKKMCARAISKAAQVVWEPPVVQFVVEHEADGVLRRQRWEYDLTTDAVIIYERALFLPAQAKRR
jgi:hypothetical protein